MQEEEGESSKEDTVEDTSTPAVWLRGPSRLPDRPIPVALRPTDSTERGYVSNLTCYYYFSFPNSKITVQTNIFS